MSSKWFVTIATSLVATLLVVGFAAAQNGAFAGLAQPIVVAIDQAVPADVTLAIPQDDGTILTTTVPITVGVNLQIAIDGAGIVSVEPAASAEEPVVDVEQIDPTGDQIDSAGRPYSVEIPEAIALEQVESSTNVLEKLEIIGDLTNTGDQPLKYTELIVTLFDADGTILGVETTYAKLQTIEPGQTSPFRLMATAAGDDVASYRIQIEGD